MKEAIVIDNGSDTMKVGFAGSMLPLVTFPTIVARPRNPQGNPNIYIGKEAEEKREILGLVNKYPVEFGTIINYDDMEKIWHHVFENELRVTASEHPILLTESPLNPKANREKATQIMFETMEAEALYLATTGPLSLYASGRTTGIVTDCGDACVLAVPVYEGVYLNHSILKYETCGTHLSWYVMDSLKKHYISNRDLRAVGREIKEKLCYVAMDYEKELKDFNAFPRDIERYFQLPDGRVITVGLERFRIPEAYFNPSLFGHESNGLHETIFNTICRCDSDLRKELYANVVLAGASSLFPGLLPRVKKELMALAPEGTEVNVDAPSSPKFSAWIGGSLIASQSDFMEKCISQEEYNEYGPNIVHAKCF